MTARILFAAGDTQWRVYEAPLRRALDNKGVDARLATDLPPAEVDYIVYAPDSAVQDFTPFIRARAVLNLWAGVEKIVTNPTLHIPLARMVDHGLTQGMVEWVTGHVLRHHLGMDTHILHQDGVWRPDAPPLASDRRVSVLGLGALGAACARMLSHLGFPVTGWSRSPKDIDTLRCLSGEAGLHTALEEADILVLLLPLTPDTESLLDAARLALLPADTVILNPGRGPLIDDDALLAALDAGKIGHATLDVFREEPLPPAHPFWAHPRVTVTPHIASETRSETAAQVIAENISRGEAGKPLLHLVDRDAGY